MGKVGSGLSSAAGVMVRGAGTTGINDERLTGAGGLETAASSSVGGAEGGGARTGGAEEEGEFVD